MKIENSKIQNVTRSGIVTSENKEHHFDLIVYATGYEHFEGFVEIEITGTNKSLKDYWNSDFPILHKQITAPGFPNMAFFGGPGTGLPLLGNIGTPVYFEYTHHNFLEILTYMESKKFTSFETKEVSMEAYKDAWFSWMNGKTFKNCISNWKSKRGMANYLIWPNSMFYMWWMSRIVDVEHHNFE